ncbi:MAG: hypothetical protein H0T65_11135 [Deltaproteobacteria bacterium]|nr:hypothetical protein [Deltaproteobacteria bacterium]
MRSWLFILVAFGCGNRGDDSKKQVEHKSPVPVEPRRCENPGGNVCVDDEVVICASDGKLGSAVERCNGGCNAGKCVETCAVRDVELVYVVDDAHQLHSFDPKKLPNDPFHRIGKLTCDPRSSPNSMAVDRKGVAWFNYHSGVLHKVSIIDVKCKQAITPSGAPTAFGMGFVTDGPNATTEKLFVASISDSQFAELDVTQKRPPWKAISTFTSAKNPELTGTGGGQLFGFFPAGEAFIQEIDRATGKLVGKRMPVGSPRGKVGAWAFAHWGGKFYVFVTIDDNSMVYEVDGKTGRFARVREKLPTQIVGAGVSTCAPLLESVPP